MSYAKAMKWQRTHRKGTKQTVIAHTGTGFWPSVAFSKKWEKYAEEQEAKGLPYVSCEDYYKSKLQ